MARKRGCGEMLLHGAKMKVCSGIEPCRATDEGAKTGLDLTQWLMDGTEDSSGRLVSRGLAIQTSVLIFSSHLEPT